MRPTSTLEAPFPDYQGGTRVRQSGTNCAWTCTNMRKRLHGMTRVRGVFAKEMADGCLADWWVGTDTL